MVLGETVLRCFRRDAIKARPKCVVRQERIEMTLENVLHCYMVEYQWFTVLHNLLHAVTNPREFRKYLTINDLYRYINDTVAFRFIPALPSPSPSQPSNSDQTLYQSEFTLFRVYFPKIANKNALLTLFFGSSLQFTSLHTKKVNSAD